MISSTIDLDVRFSETDAMGIVYHANYLPWCECARLKLLESFGVKYTHMIDDGMHLPVVSVHFNYKHPARFGDTVSIKATIAQPPRIKIRVDYEISANGNLLVTGYTEHVFINNSGAPIKPPSNFMNALRAAMEK